MKTMSDITKSSIRTQYDSDLMMPMHARIPASWLSVLVSFEAVSSRATVWCSITTGEACVVDADDAATRRCDMEAAAVEANPKNCKIPLSKPAPKIHFQNLPVHPLNMSGAQKMARVLDALARGSAEERDAASMLSDNEFCFEQLGELTLDDLKEMGMSKLGQVCACV